MFWSNFISREDVKASNTDFCGVLSRHSYAGLPWKGASRAERNRNVQFEEKTTTRKFNVGGRNCAERHKQRPKVNLG